MAYLKYLMRVAYDATVGRPKLPALAGVARAPHGVMRIVKMPVGREAWPDFVDQVTPAPG